MERRICSADGCNNLSMQNTKKKNGEWNYKKLCTKHHKQKYRMRKSPKERRKEIEVIGLSKTPCKKCGWNKSYCDIHRIKHGKDGGKYEIGNVIVLCPNCHRVEHQGIF